MAGAPPLAPGAWSPLAPARRIAFVPGNADVDGVDPNDVRQGHIGDCYLMAALMSVAAMHPEMIHDIVEPRGDGSWLVTLYDEAEAEPLSLIVRPEFPGRPWWGVFVGMSSSSAGAGDAADGKQELWPQLIEKAYAKAAGGYDAIGNGGSPAAALAAITGIPVRPTYDCCRPVDRFDLDELASALEAGQPIVASSIDTSSLEDADDATRALFQRDGWAKYVIGNAFHEGQLVTNHAYSVVAADPVRGTVTVQNPWGWEDEGLTLTLEEFQNAFWVYDTALTPPR